MLLQFPKFVPATAGAVALLALTAGCTDQDYDLGNLDTEMQIAVNELTVPLNLAPVKFESMVKLDDAECIKVDADGNYVRLDRIHFVRITTGVLQVNGPLGECSTEVAGIEKLNY